MPFFVLRRTLWLQGVISVIVLAFVVATFAVQRHNGFNASWEGSFYIVASTLPIIPMLLEARRSHRYRSAWWCVAAAVAFNTLALSVHVFQFRNMTLLPSPATSDALYLLSSAGLVIGVARFMQLRMTTSQVGTRIEGAVTGLAVAAIAGIWRFQPLLQTGDHSIHAIVEFAYPLCYLVLLALVVAGWAATGLRTNWTSTFLMIGVACWIGGDAAFLYQGATVTHVGTASHEVVWLVGIWIMGVASSIRDRGLAELRLTARTSLRASLMPVVAGLISTVVIAATWQRGTVAPSVPIIAFCAILLVIIRMWVALREENALVTSSKIDARTDTLTGLPNRRSILETIESQLESHDIKPTGMILIDLDGFKEVNDTLGHLAGDELLCMVGLRFQSKLTGRGILGRLGGDEFAFVAPTSSETELVALGRELITVLAEPIVLDGISVHVGASMGVAVSAVRGSTAVEIIRGADVAMYEAKRTKSGVAVYRTRNDPNSREQLELLSDLRMAIDARTVLVHFQPTLDMRTLRVRGVEALARWHHPELGMVYPETFIPMTERAGLMPQLTRAVLVQAISQANSFDRAGHRLQMSVNISRYDLLDGDLPDFIHRILLFHSVPANRLTIEITESSFSTDPERAAECVRRLRKRGIRVSIDDYGVGYSSMSQLLDLEIDEIKIDKSFVIGLCSDSRALAIIRSAVELARALNLNLVAEGIESQEIFDSLRTIGVDFGQGYFIARPLEPGNLEEFISKHNLAAPVQTVV